TALALTACAPPQSPGASPDGSQSSSRTEGPKRATAAIRAQPISLIQMRIQRGGAVRGIDGVEELSHAGLTYLKADNTRASQLAEVVPSIENGLWQVFPDGRMATTWKIKPG